MARAARARPARLEQESAIQADMAGNSEAVSAVAGHAGSQLTVPLQHLSDQVIALKIEGAALRVTMHAPESARAFL